ncbi:MAG: TonB-dependent receptor [Gammaproteobacteria bacterium]|nr:TonB-dependent receptor [Gammaproteobacteria bacterium]
MRKLPRPVTGRQLKINYKLSTNLSLLLFPLLALLASPLQAVDATDPESVQAADKADSTPARVTQLSQAAADAEQSTEEDLLEEVVVTGTQIKGAAISEALAVSVFAEQDIEMMGISSGDELLDAITEQGQNFQSEAENISGGVNSVRGDIGAFNLRNMGTGNTLALLNGRRMVQAAGFQTELIGGSFVPVNTVNPNAIPVLGIRRVEVLRDGASAIYGADAVAGVVNTVLKSSFDGLTIRGRYDWYDNIPRDDIRLNIEWGHDFNGGRSNVSFFGDFYHRDRVSSMDDPRWSDSDHRNRLDEDNPWFTTTSFRNTSIDSGFGQWDARDPRTGTSSRPPGITDSGGEFETYPIDNAACQHEDAWVINEAVCGLRDGVRRNPEDNRVGNWRYNLNGGLKDENGGNGIGRDLVSELDRYNAFLFFNHEFENGTEAYTEFGYYKAKTNLVRHPVATTTGVELVIGAENYYNPFGPCGSDNRLSADLISEDDVPCEGVPLLLDFYRWVEHPRIVDNDATTWRFVQGFRGNWADWDWDSAVVWSEAKREDVTSRLSNTLMQEALDDPTPAAYNPFHGGVLPSNIERAVVDVFRTNKTDLKMFDFKLSKAELFNLPAGPVGVLFGAEYRKESFKDDRDDRLDGTIAFTDVDGDTFPFISDVINSSPSSDSSGSRNTTSLFVEFAVPVFENFDVQAALRYENASDFDSTTVGKLAFGWRIFEPLLIRGSWSEAFRAPNLITINEELVVRTNTVRNYSCQYAVDVWEAGLDPDDPDFDAAEDELVCNGGVQRRASGSKELKPEKSTNTSIGFVLEPTEGMMFTLDYWRIKKKDTIGLFGEVNHSLLDALLRIENGLSGCASFVGDPAVGYLTLDPEDIPFYEAAGICPVGQMEYVEDKYANLDTRIVEGYDIGLFYSFDNSWGAWDFSLRGSFYEKYEQQAGPATQVLIDASESGVFPSTFPAPRGFDDLLRQDGNQTTKYNSSLRWRKGDWGVNLTAYYLSSFIQTSLGERDGQKWRIPSMTTFNVSFDYNVDLWGSDSRFRLGINNFTDERAPLADRYFGYFADAHRDLGRYFYLDLRMGF